jgi:single-stranded-DNA-specific exonuclease
MAAGFGLPHTKLADFHSFLDDRLAAAAMLPRAADLTLEGALSVPGATTELAQIIGRLAPFGQGNPEPTFFIPHARVVRADRIGREAATIRAMLEGEGGGPRLKALLFRAGDGPLAQALTERHVAPLHIAGHLRAESWNGTTTAGFFISDAAVPGTAAP